MAGKLRRDTILGAVFFGGLLLLLTATILLSNFSFGNKPTIQVAFPDARNVKVGDNVFVAGTKYGVVRKVDYQKSNTAYPIMMTLELNDDLTLKDDYKITIADASLLGGKQISIKTGSSGTNMTGPLVGSAPANPLQAIGELIGGEKNKKNFEAILSNLSEVTNDLRIGEGTIGEAVAKVRDFFAKAEQVAETIDLAVKDARNGEGAIGRIVAKAGDFFDKADSIAETIRSGDGIVTRLIRDKQLADDVSSAVSNIEAVTRDIKDGNGVLGKLVNDKEWVAKIDGTIDEVQKAARSINEGDGVLNAILNDAELRDGVKNIVSGIDKIVADVRAGKGTIGRLFSDDTLIQDFEKLVNQIRRVVEDQREAAPISTFVNIFTGAFQ